MFCFYTEYWQMAEPGLIRVVDMHMLLSNASNLFQNSGTLICFTCNN